MTLRRLLILVSLAAGFVAPPAHADEALFGYVTTTDSLPQERSDFQQWGTLRAGKAQGSYDAVDLRTGLGHGITSALQGTLYLGTSYIYTEDVYNPNNVSKNLPNQSNFNVANVSLELKYRLTSPYMGGPGVSVLFEPVLGIRDPQTGADQSAKGFNSRLIAQQNYLDDRLVFAGNMLIAPNWTVTNGTRAHTVVLEFDFGSSYRFAPDWYIGGTLRNRNEFPQGTADYTTFYVGPNVHYGAKDWWATFDLLPQVYGTPQRLGQDANGNTVSDATRYLGRAEEFETRLRIGINIW